MNKHLMIDIETLGTESDACVLSIAAVAFNFQNENIEVIENTRCELQPQIDQGRKIQEDTLRWWFSQDQEALLQFSIYQTATKLENHFVTISKLAYELKQRSFDTIWANSPSFDLDILKNMMKAENIAIPWKFHQERDVRTVKNFMTERIKNENKHNTLSDCFAQIKTVKTFYDKYIIK